MSTDATAVLREAAAAMLEDEHGGVFLYGVASLLLNKAEQIDRHSGKLIDPATPERVFADVYKVARAYLQEGEARPYHCPTCRGEDSPGYCTCGHYHEPETACTPDCGCRP